MMEGGLRSIQVFARPGGSVRNPVTGPALASAKCTRCMKLRVGVRIPDRNVCVQRPDIVRKTAVKTRAAAAFASRPWYPQPLSF